MDGLEGTWEIAEFEELLGDSLFFGGEEGSAVHYQAAQRELIPLGVVFESREENDRRMEAYQRIVAKLYGIGGDGKARSSHDGHPHPNYVPVVKKVEPPPPPPEAEPIEVQAIAPTPVPTERSQSELGRLLTSGSWWAVYRLGTLWFEAANALVTDYPAESRIACEWSLDHFEQYNKDWTAHLPASRWDSDGGYEMRDVNDVKNIVSDDPSLTPPPAWVSLLLAGDWEGSLAAFHEDPADEFKPMVAILAEVCKLGGKKDGNPRLNIPEIL